MLPPRSSWHSMRKCYHVPQHGCFHQCTIDHLQHHILYPYNIYSVAVLFQGNQQNLHCLPQERWSRGSVLTNYSDGWTFHSSGYSRVARRHCTKLWPAPTLQSRQTLFISSINYQCCASHNSHWIPTGVGEGCNITIGKVVVMAGSARSIAHSLHAPWFACLIHLTLNHLGPLCHCDLVVLILIVPVHHLGPWWQSCCGCCSCCCSCSSSCCSCSSSCFFLTNCEFVRNADFCQTNCKLFLLRRSLYFFINRGNKWFQMSLKMHEHTFP